MKMNIRPLLLVLASLYVTAAYALESTIDAKQVALHVGSHAIVCGTIGEVKPFAKGVYLNMGPRYPNQHIGLLLWNSEVEIFAARFGRLSNLQGKRACARGLIEKYKSSVQMKITDPDALSFSR